jgi:hypothetical protein
MGGGGGELLWCSGGGNCWTSLGKCDYKAFFTVTVATKSDSLFSALIHMQCGDHLEWV